MSNFPNDYKISVDPMRKTPFLKHTGVRCDGTTPLYRDVDGKLWTINGHSNDGRIAMFCGNTIEDMKELYTIKLNFCDGHADYAFDGIKYPEGIKARGCIWPFGLYICPKTHRFFAFFHNESGWGGRGTAYDALGPCEKPHFDSDFRHIGLMHSDNEGKHWTFDRWVLTAEKPCFTEAYNPAGDIAIGQKMGKVMLGSGDFSLYVEPDGEYIYIFYDITTVDTDKGVWDSCDTYVARTRKRDDGLMGDFVKYYNGSFCEAGNMGKETPIIKDAWHTRVAYAKKYGKYVMSSSPINAGCGDAVIKDIMEWRVSDDMIHWSEPMKVERNGRPFGNHYMAIVSEEVGTYPNVIEGDEFVILTNHNGTDVDRQNARFELK